MIMHSHWMRYRELPANECWEWTGYRDPNGYGRGPSGVLAHRGMWAASGRYLNPTLTLDHLCRNRACVNPAHMEPVPQSINNLRAFTCRLQCARGHWMFDAAVRGGHRKCRICERQWLRDRRARNAA